jgi:hypothetical protein
MVGVPQTDDVRRAPVMQAVAARWMGFEKGLLMSIRITRRDKRLRQRQLIAGTGFISPSRVNPVVSYTDRNEDSRILCGSI